MAQEFTINSSTIESKINQLLPSQGGFGAGVDFSASTMVIPIVDLTESAEGSGFRQDLQSAMSLTSQTAFNVSNATTTIINTTGYFRVFGGYSVLESSGSATNDSFNLTDGSTTKIIKAYKRFGSTTATSKLEDYDFIVYLRAGESMTITSSSTLSHFIGSSRQLADINGNLVNP